MNFIQHYLPGQPIEKNKQTSSGINFFMDVNSFTNHNESFGINLELANIDLEEFQPEELTSPNPFNNAARPKGFIMILQLIPILSRCFYPMSF